MTIKREDLATTDFGDDVTGERLAHVTPGEVGIKYITPLRIIAAIRYSRSITPGGRSETAGSDDPGAAPAAYRLNPRMARPAAGRPRAGRSSRPSNCP
jgi:hypothetical protein